MFSNIPQKEGTKKFLEALDNQNLREEPKLPTAFLMTLLTFFLTFNVFIFNGRHFIQVICIGTCIGTSAEPLPASLWAG